MATKQIDIQGIGPVTFVKSSRNRSIRLSVTTKGVRASLPQWTPYQAAVAFVLQQADWIRQQSSTRSTEALQPGVKIGKLHTLVFEQVPGNVKPTARVTATKLLVRHHPYEAITDTAVQERARTAAVRALRKETLQLLKPKVQELAVQHGFNYKEIHAKELKRRWGSCDNNGNLTFNLYLMQLPWDEIEYVLLHELTHTEHMNHGPDFWQRLTQVLPRARQLARTVRHTEPSLLPTQTATALEDDMAY